MPVKKSVSPIDQYIGGFPESTQRKLNQIREVIRKAAPKATETISYSMPAFTGNKILVWFAGYKNHIGFYPKPDVLKMFAEEISIYKNSKGAVQFPFDKPLPAALITKMVKARVKEDAKT